VSTHCSHKKLCEKKECVLCDEKSFASFEGVTPTGKKKKDCYSSNNELTPRQVFKNSGKKYEFECDVCFHSWKPSLDNVVKGFWCPYCGNQELCEKKECVLCDIIQCQLFVYMFPF